MSLIPSPSFEGENARQLNPRFAFVDLFIGGQKTPITVTGASLQGSPRQFADELGVLLKSFSYEITSTSGNLLSLEIIDPQYDALERLLTESKESIAFRFGWRSASQREVASPVIPMIVLDWNMEFVGGAGFGGTVLSLTAVDAGFVMATKTNDGAFDSSRKITDVVSELITRAGLTPDIRTPSKTLIGKDLNRQTNQSTMAYVQRLLKHAEPTRGRGYVVYREFENDGTLRVVVDSVRTKDPSIDRRYLFSRDRTGNMISFAPKYNGILLDTLGGHRSDIVTVSDLKKEASTIRSDAKADRDEAHAPKLPRTIEPGDLGRRYEYPAINADLVAAVIQSQRRATDNLAYMAEAVVVGDPNVPVLRNVEVLVLRGAPVSQADRDLVDADYHHTSGAYTVMSVQHSISPGIFHTNLTLQRAAGLVGQEDADSFTELNPTAKNPPPDTVEMTARQLEDEGN